MAVSNNLVINLDETKNVNLNIDVTTIYKAE